MPQPRKTLHTDADPYFGFTWHTSPTTENRGLESNGVKETVLRRIFDEVDKNGWTTHLDVIRANYDWWQDQAQPRPGYPEDPLPTTSTYRFPPHAPRVGDPARIDGGPGHGGRFAIQTKGQDMCEPIVNTMGYERQVTVYRRGFDTATGEWIFTDAFWMGP